MKPWNTMISVQDWVHAGLHDEDMGLDLMMSDWEFMDEYEKEVALCFMYGQVMGFIQNAIDESDEM